MFAWNNQTFNLAFVSFFLLLLLLLFHPCAVFSIDHAGIFRNGNESMIGETKIAEYNVEMESFLTKSYIVRFWGYRESEDHRAYLERNLRANGWKWIPRRNPASSFSTDLGLVSIWDLFRTGLIEELMELGRVRDISPEESYSRSLLVENGGKRKMNVYKRAGFGSGINKSSTNAKMMKKKKNAKMMREKDDVFGNSTESLFQQYATTLLLRAKKLWAKGYTGSKVKMAVFDSGIQENHPHFRNIKERTDWTNSATLDGNVEHGTFVAGVIAGQDKECLGFAPDVDIYAFCVFNDAGETKTSWMLDAFNYAIESDMDVLNLTFGESDYLDLQFVEKVREVTENNIIVISSVGNSGPGFGTLQNPADQNDVIGVGAINYEDQIAPFSSRGMTTWEIPHGYGRVKPDIVAYGVKIMGPDIDMGCKLENGTSFASPIVAGVVSLLISAIPEGIRKDIINPASMKQVLVEGATKLSGPNMYEQGAGRINILRSYKILKNYQPRASIFPSILDFTDCNYTAPLCRQPLYAGAMPVIFNATILNGMNVIGYIDTPPVWEPSNEAGNLLSIRFSYSDIILAGTGYLGLHMQIKEEGAQYLGLIEGNVVLTIISPYSPAEKNTRSSTCVLRLKLEVVPTPSRWQRVLWDQFHSINYPSGYIPADSFDEEDSLDWQGDHLHTNFYEMFNMLRDAGYYVETLGSPLTCFDANQYGTLLMVDLEDEYFEEEIEKLRVDVNGGLGLAVFADWYNAKKMKKMLFQDHNTKRRQNPVTGGANIPALNKILEPFGIAFGGEILNGQISIDDEQQWDYKYGTDIIKFPESGYMHSFPLQDNMENGRKKASLVTKVNSSVLGFVEIGSGRIAVYGDSDCLDSTVTMNTCYWLLRKVLDFTSNKIKDPVLFSDSAKKGPHPNKEEKQAPYNGMNVDFSIYSRVVGKDLICGSDSRFEVWGTRGYDHTVRTTRKIARDSY